MKEAVIWRKELLSAGHLPFLAVPQRIKHDWTFVFPELYYDRGNHHEFVSLVKDLARPGEFTQSQTFDFEFTHVEKPYESYTGQNVKLR